MKIEADKSTLYAIIFTLFIVLLFHIIMAKIGEGVAVEQIQKDLQERNEIIQEQDIYIQVLRSQMAQIKSRCFK